MSPKLNMDERESVLTNNQAAENLEQDFQFTNGVPENADNTTIKQYNRDILLQLRLHPLSLQKPKELPEMEVIKEKLYLTDITNMTSNSPEKSMDASTCYPYMKPDYRPVKSDLPLLPPYFSRVYPYCYSPYSYNGSYQSAPLKCRSSYNALCNPLKKHCMALHSCLRDLPLEECSWMKHFPPSDDMWHCYSNSVSSGIYKRKEHLEAVPKSKKKLPVIDPVTGKDILETVIPSQPEQSSVKESSNSVENYMAAKEQCGDHLCSSKENQEAVEYKSVDTKYDSALFSSGDKTCFEQQKYSGVEFETDTSAESLKNKSEDSSSYSASTMDYSQDEKSRDLKDENVDPSEVKNNTFEFPKTSEKSHKYDTSIYNKQVPQNSYNREINPYFDVHGACRAHPIKECHLCNKNISKQHDTMQESFKQLREKMKQEEQKLAILQSFLKYKKYQLEESARNLDEKRIEIANWEYNLYNTAKLLQEKEQWLENKNEILSNKIQQLIEKEKLLKEEDKISSDTLYSDAFKEVGVSEKKFSYHKNEAKWSGISKMKNPKIDENNQYSFVSYDPKPPKMFEGMQSNVEKCKSDAFSLDELEKNLVFMEKMHSANEVNDTNVNKIELASSTNTGQKSNVNAPYDPLGYSKGQRYLPDYLNNWLDKKDKSAL